MRGRDLPRERPVYSRVGEIEQPSISCQTSTECFIFAKLHDHSMIPGASQGKNFQMICTETRPQMPPASSPGLERYWVDIP
jgi:hypothetical protein